MENSNGKIVCYKLFRKDANGSLFLLGTLGTDDFFGKLPLFLQKAIFLSAQ